MNLKMISFLFQEIQLFRVFCLQTPTLAPQHFQLGIGVLEFFRLIKKPLLELAELFIEVKNLEPQRRTANRDLIRGISTKNLIWAPRKKWI